MYSTHENFLINLKSAVAEIAFDAFELEGSLPYAIGGEITDEFWNIAEDGEKSIDQSGLEKFFTHLIDTNDDDETDLITQFVDFAQAIDRQRQAEAEEDSDDEEEDAEA